MDARTIYHVTPYGDETMLFIHKDKNEAYVKSIIVIPINYYYTTYHVMEYKMPICPDEELGSILARVNKVISDHREEWNCEAHRDDTTCLDCGDVFSEYRKMKAGLF